MPLINRLHKWLQLYNYLFRSAWIIPSHGADWEPDSFKSQSQINASMALWETDESLYSILDLHRAKFCGWKIFTAGTRVAFFTTILTILLLFLQIIVLRAHIEGYWPIFNSMEFYFPPSWSIHVWFTATTSMIHSLPSWSTNRWNTAFYGLFPLISLSFFCFHLPPSSAKVNGVCLRSTGLRHRFQLCGYSG